ncbi:MAG: response regulator [Acidobacteriota bacterium]
MTLPLERPGFPWWISPSERIEAVRRAVAQYMPAVCWVNALLLGAMIAAHLTFGFAYNSVVKASHFAGLVASLALAEYSRRRSYRPGDTWPLHAQGVLTAVIVVLQMILLENVPDPEEVVPHCFLVFTIGMLVISRRWALIAGGVLHLHFATVAARHFASPERATPILAALSTLAIAVTVSLARDAYLWRARQLRLVAEEGRRRAEESLERLENESFERQRLQAKLVASEKSESLGRLAGGIAHDFNNLLVPILTNADLLESSELPEEERQMAAEIRQASERASLLVKQLLSYAGRATTDPTLVDLNDEVETLAQLVRTSVSSHIDLEVVRKDDAPEVLADRAQLQQVLLNLILNAAQSIEGTGSVKVAIEETELNAEEAGALLPAQHRKAGHYLRVHVADDGSGIDEEVQARMFDPFFTTKPEGKGLGLSSVLSFAAQHHGGLEMTSVSGLGTTMSLVLPKDSNLVTESDDGAAATVDAENRQILLVDDDHEARRVAERCLTTAGYEVLEADCGTDAVEIVRGQQKPIDGLVLDLRMPGMSGSDTFDAVRRDRPSLPVLICSGHSEGTVVEQLLAEDSVSFLAKPYTRGALLSTLARLLGVDAGAKAS